MQNLARRCLQVGTCLGEILVPPLEEARVDDPAARQGEIGFDRIQLPIGFRQRGGIAPENRAFVEQPGPLDSLVHADDRLAQTGDPPGCHIVPGRIGQ